MQHLDRAGELFRRCGAKLYLDEVLAKKQIPEGVSSNLQGGLNDRHQARAIR